MPDNLESDIFQPSSKPDEGQVDILIAEDHTGTPAGFAQMLENTRYTFKVAKNAQQAVDMFDHYRPRLVFSDISMSLRDGLQFTEEIRRRELGSMHRTPVIGITPHAAATEVRSWADIGMDGFLPKPVTAEALIAKAEAWLNPALRQVA